MSVNIKYFPYIILFTILFFGCGKADTDKVFKIGIDYFFNNLPFDMTDNIFNNKVCILNSIDLASDVEFEQYIEHKFIERGYKEVNKINDQKLLKLMEGYFEEVNNCNLPQSKKSIRNICRDSKALCVGVSPLYRSKDNGDYFFTLVMPPNIGVDIKVNKEMETKIINFDIK